ncbi:hypothetical protein K438DRAFT_1776984 [Mycena galopus ATCC 62051]|nr:hypothetical protein K438DRAFT_1776984 [Mycena galopus ATCC 62051]
MSEIDQLINEICAETPGGTNSTRRQSFHPPNRHGFAHGKTSFPTGLFVDFDAVAGVEKETIDVIDSSTRPVPTSVPEAMPAVALYAAQKASDTAWSLDASGAQRADLINKLASLAEIMGGYKTLKRVRARRRAGGAGVRGVLRLLLLAEASAARELCGFRTLYFASSGTRTALVCARVGLPPLATANAYSRIL